MDAGQRAQSLRLHGAHETWVQQCCICCPHSLEGPEQGLEPALRPLGNIIMTGENIRKSLHDGRRVCGTHICGFSSAVVTRILGTATLDFAFICNEHMPVDRAETSVLCQHFGSMGISPIVRIPTPDAGEAAMA